MINLQRTGDATSDAIKVLLYGGPGVGKTSQAATLPDPVILSAEAGLLSIADANLPFIVIKSMDDLREAYSWLINSDEAKAFKTVMLDSISEIAEVCLATEKAKAKDPRQAYGEMQTTMTEVVRLFRDIPDKHVVFTAKMEKATDEMGRMLYSPSMPGNKTAQALPYFFDEVLALRVEKDADGQPQRGIMAQPDGLWTAKDRSGKLDAWEPAHLGDIIKKIGG